MTEQHNLSDIPTKLSVHEAVAEGDPAARATRIGSNGGLKLGAAGVLGVSAMEALGGESLLSASMPAYAVLAIAGAIALNRRQARHERGGIIAANMLQEHLRRPLGEPVDVMANTKYGLLLRWYGGDEAWAMDKGSEAEEQLPARLRKVAHFAQTNGIERIVVGKELRTYIQEDLQQPEIGIVAPAQELTKLPRSKTQDIKGDEHVVHLTIAEAKRVADILTATFPEKEEEKSPLESLSALFDAHAPMHPLHTPLKRFVLDGSLRHKEALMHEARQSIEERFSSLTPVNARRDIASPSRNRGSVSVHVHSEDLHEFQYERSQDGREVSYMHTTKLLEKIGYKDFETLWQDLTSTPIACKSEQIASYLEVATLRLAQAAEASSQQHTGNYVAHGPGTFFQRLASRKEGILLKNGKEKLQLLSATIGTAALIGMLGPQSVHALDRATVRSDSLAAQVTQDGLSYVRRVDARMNEYGAAALGAGLDALGSLYDIPEQQSPLEESSTFLDFATGEIGDARTANDAGVAWELQASPGVRVDGYWFAAVQSELVRVIDGVLPPYEDRAVHFVQSPNLTETAITHPTVAPSELPRDGQYIRASTLVSAFSLDRMWGDYKGQKSIVVPLPVREGTTPVAVQVEVLRDKQVTRKIAVSVQRTQTQTFFIPLSGIKDLAAEVGDGVRISVWLTPQDSPAFKTKAIRPIGYTGYPLHEALSAQDAGVVVRSLGYKGRVTPEELATFIKRTKLYSRSPYNDYGTDLWKSNNDPIVEVVSMASAVAALPTQVCNTATFVAAIGSRGGTAEHFVNPVAGFINNGDGALTYNEGHLTLIDNKGEIVEPTPERLLAGQRRFPFLTSKQIRAFGNPSRELLPGDGQRERNGLLSQTWLFGALLGAGALVMAVRRLRDVPGRIYDKAADALLDQLLHPRSQFATASIHVALDTLQALLFSRPGLSTHQGRTAHSLSLAHRYKSLGAPSKGVVKQRMQEWQYAGQPLTWWQQRQVMTLVRLMGKTQKH